MADDAAVLDVTDVDLGDAADDGSSNDTGDDTQQTADQEARGDQTQADDESAVVEDDNGRIKLSPTAKAPLDEIKAENPRLAKELRAAAFDASALRKEFPEGIREAVALKQEFEALGGKEGVERMKAEVGDWQALDKDWVSGNPKLIDDLATGNPESFIKLGPSMLNKFAELDPDGFSGHVGRIVTSDMASFDIPLQMRLMARDLFEGGSPQLNGAGQITNVKDGMQALAEGWAKIAGYVDRMSTLASKTGKKTETTGNKDDSQLTEREQRVQQAEQRAMESEWLGERGKIENSLLDREWKKLTAGRKLTPTQLGTIKELYEVTRDRMSNQDKAGKDKVSRFAAAKDKEGYRRFISGAYGNIVPKALKAAFDKIVPTKPGPKTTTTPAAKSGTRAAPTADNTGFTRSATKPDKNQVNWQMTNSIRGKKPGDGKFIMRDGSKVLYSR